MAQGAAFACLHCGAVVPSGAASRYCCAGCETAHGFVEGLGLARFYDLKGSRVVAPADVRSAPSVWIEALLAESPVDTRGTVTVLFALRGLHCAACIWLVEKLFERRAGARRVIVEPGRGLVRATFDRSRFELQGFVDDLARVGLRAAPYEVGSGEEEGADELLLRLGLTGGLAMIGMVISFAIYLGLDAQSEPALFRIFAGISALLALASVLVALPVFGRGAWLTLRRGELHVDLPIALGLTLAYVGSVVAAWRGLDASAAYFDTVETFAALMLFGRYLQRRQLETSRGLAIGESALDRWPVRIAQADGTLRFVRAGDLPSGARVLLAKGELLVAKAVLHSSQGLFDAAARTGEGDPIAFSAGAVLPAGLRYLGERPVEVVLEETFAQSELPAWLGAPRTDDVAFLDAFWQRFVRVYVASILILAGAGGAYWGVHAGFDKALSVVVAVLVVTCPCAIGLAAPLAYELAHARLRERGIVVRSATFLDRLTRVKHVLFDKTGTLTRGEPVVANVEALRALNESDRAVVASMVAASTHPKSRAIAEALTGEAPRRHVVDRVVETAGQGLEVELAGGARYAIQAASEEPEAVDVVREGEVVATVRFREGLRAGAASAVASLEALGKTVHMLSGDGPRRVEELAAGVGIASHHAHARLSPEGKAAIVRSLAGEGTLYVGDGLNDGPAVHAATASATPCIDRPMLPARVDAFGTTGDLRVLAEIFPIAERVASFRRAMVGAALAYNAVVVAIAFAGLMSPFLCAILMPVSSLGFVAWTVRALGARMPETTAPCPNPSELLRSLEAAE
jgi:Cu2+-exporting ATPase